MQGKIVLTWNQKFSPERGSFLTANQIFILVFKFSIFGPFFGLNHRLPSKNWYLHPILHHQMFLFSINVEIVKIATGLILCTGLLRPVHGGNIFKWFLISCQNFT